MNWILDTIDKLVQTYQIDGLLALDDNFCADPERVRAIFEGVRARGHTLNWWVELRIDQVLEMSVKELRELRALGLRIAYMGVESGCNRMLRLFNKGITVDQIYQANRKLAQTDIATCYTFIIGAPTETSRETLETVDLAVKLLEENPLASVWQFNQYTPYPGTSLYKFAIRNGFKPLRSLEDWDVGWTVRDQNLSSTSLSKSEMATLRYAALFQTPDLHLTNRSFIYKVVYKFFRKTFAFRLRRHFLTPFLDTWAIGLLFGVARLINRWRIDRLSSRIFS
jgi:radical SAM superfamily enzyme YgiQ (UPF0313 family)